ncbi:hypothetical protein [Aeromonas veronii]|uniref:hypothetical protein n=1 Tax=Aeromonas veronii TaxID=654 RepID=UPI003F790F01
MSSFYTRDGELFASCVDVKRLAREIRKLSSSSDPMPMHEALELVARLLGARNEYDMRQRAVDPDISRMPREEIDRLLQESALRTGQKFPKRLPSKFGLEWQKKAQRLFEQAVQTREQGQLEFIALIGSEGSGKTLLANHMCQHFGGYVADVELYKPYTFLTKPMSHKPGEVLIYDRPTKAATAKHADIFFELARMNIGPEFRSLENYRQKMRSRQPLIPNEEIQDPLASTTRHWVLNNSQVAMVISFASREEVEEAISQRKSPAFLSDHKGSFDWRRVHVVDLDNMTQYTLDGPGQQGAAR